MTRHYAIEITLTRPASPGELRRARQHVALAENADRTRLMSVQRAKNPDGALHRMRRRLDGQLPLDVLATHYPDGSGHLLLNVDLGRTATRAIRREARAHGQYPREFLGRRLAEAVERSQQDRRRRLTSHLETLLHQHTREEVLTCAASLLSHRQPPATP
ncbi:hypothetical protein [Streptomyces sp. NPDC058614]|uniref:hypothetical protein n=1 Tax=Streptomyces sp. NPDC058614 TaxID=3346557 RepID=UPI00365CC7BF